MVDPDGNPMAGGDVPMCLTCHAAVEDNDYVYLHDFSVSVDADAGVPDSAAPVRFRHADGRRSVTRHAGCAW